MKYIISALLLFLVWNNVSAQTHHNRFETIDVFQYVFDIHLNDTTNVIEGSAYIVFKYKKPIKNITLDLMNINSKGTGMKVKSVEAHHHPIEFTHKNNQLIIDYEADTTGSVHIGEITINYSGIPADGLIISNNKYGDRTFFGDNWPNRAKHWLPTIDHPSDKAPVAFIVYAPEHYKIVSNGKLDGITTLGGGYKKTIWREEVPISTKLMVIGVADFEVGNKTNYKDIPVCSWVFQQNKKKGFENYKYGTKALEYFSELIGPYSYEKLAHVQSKTRYGGMENASCIFYNENTAISNQNQEGLFAHEVAHQWFGNSVTEQNWHHVWLSEGFATYLTHVYKQHFHGEDVFRDGLKKDRERIIKYSKRNLAPIIDTTVIEYIRLLNTNSYQKASWFLHMLRENLGNDVFFEGLQKYYADFQNSTALTKDFQKVMEEVSGKDLNVFFKQWLWQAGHPVLSLAWKNQTTDNKTVEQHFSIHQQTENLFTFPLEVEIYYMNGSMEFVTVEINGRQKEQQFVVKTTSKIKNVKLDPNTKLLFEIEGKIY